MSNMLNAAMIPLDNAINPSSICNCPDPEIGNPDPFFMTRCCIDKLAKRDPKRLAEFWARFIKVRHLPAAFTINPYTLTFPASQEGSYEEMYIVSLYGYEGRFESSPTITETIKWIMAGFEMLRKGHLIGGWLDQDTGEYCLDISTVVYGLDAAMAFAQRNAQKEIYHPFSKASLSVPAHKLNSLAIN